MYALILKSDIFEPRTLPEPFGHPSKLNFAICDGHPSMPSVNIIMLTMAMAGSAEHVYI